MADRNTRWRLLLGLGLGMALALGVAWQVGKRILDVDRYRSLVEAELERSTGLPVTIARLDLALRPVPALSAFDVSIGEGELQAVAPRIYLLPALGPLWERRLEISRIDLGELELILPSDPDRLQRRWDTLVQRVAAASLPAPAATASLWDSLLSGVAVHRVLAKDTLVRLGQSGDPWILGSVEVSGLTDADVDVDLATRLLAFGTQITGRLRIPRDAGAGSEIEGDFRVSADWPDDATGVPEALRSGLEATALLRGDPERELRLTIDGTLEPRAARAFSGNVSGELLLADGVLRANFATDGPELQLNGSARRGADGFAELRIDSLDADRAGVMAVIDWLGPDFVELSTSEVGTLAMRDVALGFRPDGGAPQLVSGSLSAEGLGAGLAGRSMAREIFLEAEATEAGVTIRTLRGGPFDLTGDLNFEPDWSQFEIAVRGDIALTPDLLESLGVSALENVSGRIHLEELRQAFPAQAMRDELPALRARVIDATLGVSGDGWADVLSGIDLRVTTEGARLSVDGRGRSRALGDVNASASWSADESETRAQVAIDPAAGDGFGSAALWEAAKPLLRAWGSNGVEVTALWPEGPGEAVWMGLERSAPPTLHARIALHPDRSDGVLGDVRVDAQVPARSLGVLLPAGVETSGTAALQLQRDSSRETFSVDADLGALALRSGHFVEKRPGEVLRLKVEGDAPAHGLRVKRLHVASAKQSLPLEWREERLVASDLDIDLAAWSFLLTGEATAAGRLRGALATNPLDVRLELSNVGVQLSPELAIDAADGTIALGEAGWSLGALRIRGAGSDVRIEAALEGERLQGSIIGALLDVDLVQALVDEVRALLPEPTQEATPMRGTLAMELDRVLVGRSEARGLDAEVHFDGNGVHVPAFDFGAYEGRVSGTLDLVAQPDGPRRLDLLLEITDVSGRFLDDLFFEEAPRDIHGAFSATLAFAAPLADDLKTMLAAGDGRLSWSARNGSFGKLHIASKIATALRASQALRLRMPALKDEGLAFDTVEADFPIQKGLLRIAVFQLDTTSYAINAVGSLDFARDRSDVPIEVNATRGLTMGLDRLPIVGDALQIVNVQLQATGSPYDLTVRMASFKDQVVRASRSGPKSFVKRVRDAVALTKRLNGKAPEPIAVPEAAAPGEDATLSPRPDLPPDASSNDVVTEPEGGDASLPGDASP